MYRVLLSQITSLDHIVHPNVVNQARIKNYGMGPVFQMALAATNADTGVEPMIVTVSKFGVITLRSGKTTYDALVLNGWLSAGVLFHNNNLPVITDSVTLATPYWKDIVLGTDDGVDPFSGLSDSALTGLIAANGILEPLSGSISGTTVTITSGVRRYNLARGLGINYFPTYLR